MSYPKAQPILPPCNSVFAIEDQSRQPKRPRITTGDTPMSRINVADAIQVNSPGLTPGAGSIDYRLAEGHEQYSSNPGNNQEKVIYNKVQINYQQNVLIQKEKKIEAEDKLRVLENQMRETNLRLEEQALIDEENRDTEEFNRLVAERNGY